MTNNAILNFLKDALMNVSGYYENYATKRKTTFYNKLPFLDLIQVSGHYSLAVPNKYVQYECFSF